MNYKLVSSNLMTAKEQLLHPCSNNSHFICLWNKNGQKHSFIWSTERKALLRLSSKAPISSYKLLNIQKTLQDLVFSSHNFTPFNIFQRRISEIYFCLLNELGHTLLRLTVRYICRFRTLYCQLWIGTVMITFTLTGLTEDILYISVQNFNSG